MLNLRWLQSCFQPTCATGWSRKQRTGRQELASLVPAAAQRYGRPPNKIRLLLLKFYHIPSGLSNVIKKIIIIVNYRKRVLPSRHISLFYDNPFEHYCSCPSTNCIYYSLGQRHTSNLLPYNTVFLQCFRTCSITSGQSVCLWCPLLFSKPTRKPVMNTFRVWRRKKAIMCTY